MPARRKSPKIEALVVNAIRRLQDVQGSSTREISNYISQEYDVPAKEIRQLVHLALKRGLSYGILQRSKGGYYTCNRDYVGQLSLGDGATGDGVVEPCPGHGRWRIYWRKRRAAERRRRETRRRWEERKKREKARRRRTRKRSRRPSRRRGRRRRSTRRRSRRRGSRRRRTARGRGGTKGRRRGRRSGARGRIRSDLNEIETETIALEPKGRDASRDENRQDSGTSISEYSNEQQDTSQNPQPLNKLSSLVSQPGLD